MNGNYIVKNKNGIIISFCFENNNIFLKEYSADKWLDKGCLAKSVRGDFSVNISDEGDLYLLCQRLQGDIILINNKDNLWNEKVILKSKIESVNNILFYALIHKTEMELIYIIDHENKKSDIMAQNAAKGLNSPAVIIDSALSLPEGIFKMQKIKNSHYIVFYQKRNSENQLGYREINADKRSDYISLFKTGYRITDSSFVADESGIHFLYIVKSMFSSQLIYRKKDEKGLNNPIVLYEGQTINLCSIFFAKDILYASWIINKQLFYCISKSEGNEFERAVRDKKYNSVNWSKANYLGFDNMNKETLLTNEIFCDNKKNYEPVFIPDIYEQFYKANYFEKPEPLKETNQNKETDEGILIQLERMKNQVEIAQKQSNEKDRQLIQLNNILQAKNRELLKVENNLTKKIKELKAEINLLKAEKNNNILKTPENNPQDEKNKTDN